MVDHIRHVLETEADDNLWSAGHEDSQMDEFWIPYSNKTNFSKSLISSSKPHSSSASITKFKVGHPLKFTFDKGPIIILSTGCPDVAGYYFCAMRLLHIHAA